MNLEKKPFVAPKYCTFFCGKKGIYIFLKERKITICLDNKSSKEYSIPNFERADFLDSIQIIEGLVSNTKPLVFLRINSDGSLKIEGHSKSDGAGTIFIYLDDSKYDKYYVVGDKYPEDPLILEIDLSKSPPKETNLGAIPAELYAKYSINRKIGRIPPLAKSDCASFPRGHGERRIECAKTNNVYYIKITNYNLGISTSNPPTSFEQIYLIRPRTNKMWIITLKLPYLSYHEGSMSHYAIYGRFFYVFVSEPGWGGLGERRQKWFYFIDLKQSDNDFIPYLPNTFPIEYYRLTFLDKEMVFFCENGNVHSLDYFEVRPGALNQLTKRVRGEITTFWCCLKKRKDLPTLSKDIRFYIVSFLI